MKCHLFHIIINVKITPLDYIETFFGHATIIILCHNCKMRYGGSIIGDDCGSRHYKKKKKDLRNPSKKDQ